MGSFFKGVGESLWDTVKSALPPYQLYQNAIKPIYQLTTNQISVSDLQTSPAELWNGVKSYYDLSTSEGLGRLTGTVIVTAVSAYAMASAAPASAAASSTCTTIPNTTKALALYYPPNRGALGNWTDMTLFVGKKIARYGETGGRYATDIGTPKGALSLDYVAQNTAELHIYEVVKPIPVQQSTAMAWFGCFGGGTQYSFYDSINLWIKYGFLK